LPAQGTIATEDVAGAADEAAAPLARARVGAAARWAQIAVLALPALILADRAWDRRWMTDDGFINLRISRMILDGHGPVFNAGERVEPATSTLWVWLIAAGDVVLPLRMEWVAVVLGLVAAVAGLALATFGSARLFRSRGATGVLLPLGALVVAAVPPFWEFSTSGLEGGLTFGWLGLVGWLLCRWAAAGRRFGVGAAVVVGLAPLVRPDLGLALPVVLGGVLLAQWPHDRGRDRVRLLAAALALPVAYQVFRMGFYGALVPNTALAKSGGRGLWSGGWAYTRDFVEPYWLAVPLAFLALAVGLPFLARAWRVRDRRGLVALVALPLVGLVDALYVIRVGGDYMHGRLLLPALFALVSPLAAVPVTRVGAAWRTAGPAAETTAATTTDGDAAAAEEEPSPSGPAEPDPSGSDAGADAGTAWGRRLLPVALVTSAAVVVVWAAVAGTTLRRPNGGAVPGLFVSEAHDGHLAAHGRYAVTAVDQGWGPDKVREMLDAGVRAYLPDPLPGAEPRDGQGRIVYAGWGIGVGGYALGEDVYVLDMLGLADPLVSRFELERPGATGHEKPIPAAWVAARVADGPVPEDLVPVPFFAPPLYASPPGELDDDAAAARRALECGALVDLSDAVRDPLTPSRFLRNIVESPSLTRLTVPPDPHEAEQRFCG
jgi:arabinofuranosyltransferase